MMSVSQPFYGKYRGKVLDNVDPLVLGRLLAYVPSVPGAALNWAMPCVAFAGVQQGFFAMPQIDANVWIEFEGGDPNYPIWSGCFWSEGEVPLEGPPLTKVLKTEFITLTMSDAPGAGFTLEVLPPASAVPLTMSFNEAGIEISCPPSSLVMTPEGITITTPPAVVAVSEGGIELGIPPSSLTLSEVGTELESEEISLTGNVTAEGPVEITGDLAVAGATELALEVAIGGAVEIVGDVVLAGAQEIAGDLLVAGATELLLEVAIGGAIEIAGDLALVGAQEIVGDLAVLGLIEGVIVPPF